MLLARPFVRFLGREVARRLVKDEAIKAAEPEQLESAVEQVLLDELEAEDRIDAEAREILKQYDEYMRRNNITYHQMFQRVKKKILDERKITPAASREGDMKLSREKIVELSHKISGKLPRLAGVRVMGGWNDVRLKIAQAITDLLAMEHKVDERARQMILSQKRNIVEGGEEWRILHRRYYEQEMARLGVDLRAPETPQV